MSAAARTRDEAKLSAKDRIEAIRNNLRKLQTAAPASWQTWTANRTHDFRNACLLLLMARKLTDALPHAQLIAKEYGVDMASIDPRHGEAA